MRVRIRITSLGIWIRRSVSGTQRWILVTTGGKYGRRSSNGVCYVSAEKNGDPIVDLNTWGTDSVTVVAPASATEIIVAVQSATHGWGTRWGSCGQFLCYDQASVEFMRTH